MEQSVHNNINVGVFCALIATVFVHLMGGFVVMGGGSIVGKAIVVFGRFVKCLVRLAELSWTFLSGFSGKISTNLFKKLNLVVIPPPPYFFIVFLFNIKRLLLVFVFGIFSDRFARRDILFLRPLFCLS